MLTEISQRVKHRPLLVYFRRHLISIAIFLILIFATASFSLFFAYKLNIANNENSSLSNRLSIAQANYIGLKNQDQYKINQQLKANINNIETTYKAAASEYEKIADLKAQKQDTSSLDKEFAQSLNYLSALNYSSASASLKTLTTDVNQEEAALAAAQVKNATPVNITQSNTPPSSGFSVQQVTTSNGSFTVYIIAADLNSTKIIVDTASNGDCSNNCPVLPLEDYISRNGAYAGINGSYFCPVDYPSCSGKSNSFDLLVMNKNKVYFNSANNVYSTNPAVIFQGSSIRFVQQALSWGRDTSVDSVLSNYPLLVFGGNVVYSGGGSDKYLPKAARTFIANKGNMAYIGIVFDATMVDSANVMKAMGMDNAMNLDQGGSTALWYGGGYKAGPGRNIPNAILFVRK